MGLSGKCLSDLRADLPHQPLQGPSGEKESERLLVVFDRCPFPPPNSRTVSPVLTLLALAHTECVCKDFCVKEGYQGTLGERRGGTEDTNGAGGRGGCLTGGGLDTRPLLSETTGSQRFLSTGTWSRLVSSCSPVKGCVES